MDLQVENPQVLIDCILDWRDADEETRENGARKRLLQRPRTRLQRQKRPVRYRRGTGCWVKGVTAAVLYGEDVNRNGILDMNEDDGEDSFPFYDNGDDVLNHGWRRS